MYENMTKNAVCCLFFFSSLQTDADSEGLRKSCGGRSCKWEYSVLIFSFLKNLVVLFLKPSFSSNLDWGVLGLCTELSFFHHHPRTFLCELYSFGVSGSQVTCLSCFISSFCWSTSSTSSWRKGIEKIF